MYVFTYVRMGGQTDGLTDRQTDRRMDRRTYVRRYVRTYARTSYVIDNVFGLVDVAVGFWYTAAPKMQYYFS